VGGSASAADPAEPAASRTRAGSIASTAARAFDAGGAFEGAGNGAGMGAAAGVVRPMIGTLQSSQSENHRETLARGKPQWPTSSGAPEEAAAAAADNVAAPPAEAAEAADVDGPEDGPLRPRSGTRAPSPAGRSPTPHTMQRAWPSALSNVHTPQDQCAVGAGA